MPEFHVQMAPAGQSPRLARDLAEGQRRALHRYGLDHLVPAEFLDLHPDTHLLALCTENGAPCAGLRLHRRTADRVLPLEQAVTLKASTREVLQQRTVEGLAELGAFWVGPEVKGRKVALRLLEVALAACPLLDLRHLVVLTGHHALRLATVAGFQLDEEEQVFAYPDERYRSFLCWYSVHGPAPRLEVSP